MFKRIAMLAAAVTGALVASAAPAATFTFDFTKADYYNQSDAVTEAWYGNTTTGGAQSTLGVHITAWQLYDSADSGTGYDDVRTAKVGIWTGNGLGVDGNNESTDGYQHTIDNTKQAVDFLVFQFSTAVSINTFGRQAWTLSDISGSPDTDASYFADVNNTYVKTTDWTSYYNLTTANPTTTVGIAESVWKQIDGGGTTNTATVTPAVTSSIWLIGAAVLPSGDRDDAFKLSGMTVSTPSAAVPEPSTWAMMIVGFGAIGASLRRRRLPTLRTVPLA